jgi:hypothetical protein
MVDAPAQRVFHRARLLVDFLEHEVWVLAALGLLRVKFQVADLHLGGVRAQVLHIEPLAGDRRHVVVVEIDHLLGVGDDGVGVAGQEILVLAQADDQRRTAPGADDHAGRIDTHQRQAVGADDFAQGLADGLGQARGILGGGGLIMASDQMRQDFGVGRGTEGVALGQELLLEAVAIFNDAVMYDGDFAGLIEVRMGILIRRRPMRGPARVADADRAGGRLLAQQHGQTLVDIAHFLAHMQPAPAQNGHASAVIAAILQPAQTLNEDRAGVLSADVANNAAHNRIQKMRQRTQTSTPNRSLFPHSRVACIARRFQVGNKCLHTFEIIVERFTAQVCDFISCLWPQADERLFAGHVSACLQFAKMQIQAAIHRLEPFLQRSEVLRPIDLQRRHDPQPDGAVNGRVKAVEINGRLFHARHKLSIADAEWPRPRNRRKSSPILWPGRARRWAERARQNPARKMPAQTPAILAATVFPMPDKATIGRLREKTAPAPYSWAPSYANTRK